MRARNHPSTSGVRGFMESYGSDYFPALIFDFFPLGDLRAYVEDNEETLSTKSRLGLVHIQPLQLSFYFV